MKKKNRVVFGIYKNRSSIERAVEKLKEAGFQAQNLSILMPENATNDDFTHIHQTKAPEGTVTGAGTGVLLGGALGWLAGTGALAFTGLGPLIAAGPILAMLTGAGVAGAVGGLTGGLIGLGIPEHEAKRYEKRVHEGGLLLSVHTEESFEEHKALKILETTGAEDISTSDKEQSEALGVSVSQIERSLRF